MAAANDPACLHPMGRENCLRNLWEKCNLLHLYILWHSYCKRKKKKTKPKQSQNETKFSISWFSFEKGLGLSWLYHPTIYLWLIMSLSLRKISVRHFLIQSVWQRTSFQSSFLVWEMEERQCYCRLQAQWGTYQRNSPGYTDCPQQQAGTFLSWILSSQGSGSLSCDFHCKLISSQSVWL